ncbi:11551_t:CDS:2, partial [Ambispora leptoticha]
MDAPTPTYTFANGVPTDPQVLKVYNGLSRVQRAMYDTADDQGKTILLAAVADEKKKPRHYLNLVYAVINLLSVIGFNIWSHFQRRGGDQDFIKCWNNYKPEQDMRYLSLFNNYWDSVGGSGRPNLDVGKYRDFFYRSWDI